MRIDPLALRRFAGNEDDWNLPDDPPGACHLFGMGGGGAPAQAAQQQNNIFAQNLMIRHWWTDGGGPLNPMFPPALNMWQQVPVNPGTLAPGSVVTTPLRNVGLHKRYLIRVTGTVTAPAGQAQTLGPLGLPALISNVTFTDLSNYQRINTPGWHLHWLSSAKRRRVFGAAYTTDTPCQMGDNFTTVMQAPATIGAGASGNFQFQLEVPVAYDDKDLTGAIFCDVVQASLQLAFTFNPQMFAVAGADPTFALYQSAGATAATLSNVVVSVYINYLDQGPRGQNNVPILPPLDTSSGYLLNNSVSPGAPVVNADNTFAFTNSRRFLSVFFTYDNAGTLNVGSDITRVRLQSANLTNITDEDPFIVAFKGRNIIGADLPKGTYYQDYRHRPVDTTQNGNMQLDIVPSSVGGASAAIFLFWESIGVIGIVNQGGASPSGA